MLFTNTTEVAATTAASGNDDLILEKTGRYVKFSNEVSQHIVENRSSDNQFTLHQSVMSITCNESADVSTIEQSVRATLEKASIQWNIIAINPKTGSTAQPALFSSLTFPAIIKAAKKAGIIPGSRTSVLIALSGVAIISIFLGSFAGLLFTHEPFSATAILNVIRGSLENPVVPGVTLALFTFLSILFAVVFRNVESHNPLIRSRIAAAVEAIGTSRQTDAAFIGAVKNQVLALTMPLAIICADFNRLDFFSRSVLQSILSTPSDDTVSVLLWILCEHEEPSGKEQQQLPKSLTNHHYRFVDRKS